MAMPSHATAKDVVLQALTSSKRTGLSPGQVRGVVVATGMDTEGRIAGIFVDV